MTMRLAAVLIVAACGSGAPPPPPQRVASQPPEPGVLMTPLSEDSVENRLYVSIWQHSGQPVLSLLCTGPCLPDVRKPFSSDAEAYRSELIREVVPGIWEATMHLEASMIATAAKQLTMRLDLRGDQPLMELDGRKHELARVSFQDAAYHLMEREGQREAMLFASTDGRELLIKPAPAGKAIDDSFLYLSPDAPKVQTVRARNWRYRLDPKVNHDVAGAYFAVLHGELGLPRGDATITLDILRSPVSDVAFALTRGGKPTRFQQTNDSNTRRFEACSGGKCQVVFTALSDVTSTCPNPDPSNRIAIRIDPDGSWHGYTADAKHRLLDRDCKVAYAYDYVGETKLVLKTPAGETIELASPKP
jgi:hypothetical protein